MKTEFFKQARELVQRIDIGTIIPEVNARFIRRGMKTEDLFPVITHILRSTLGTSSGKDMFRNMALMAGTGYAGLALIGYEAPRTGFLYGREAAQVIIDRLQGEVNTAE